MSDVTPFTCPHCAAAYNLVHIEAEESASDPEILCLRCGSPLPARKGGFLHKYLFVDRRAKQISLSPVELEPRCCRKEEPRATELRGCLKVGA